MNTSVAMLALFVIRLAVPVTILLSIGEWLSRLENDSSFPRKNLHS